MIWNTKLVGFVYIFVGIMDDNDIVLPNLIVRRLELEPHHCDVEEPDYCRQYDVRFYNTDTNLLKLKHDQQFDQVMEVYQQYINFQQERFHQLVGKASFICNNICCAKQKTCTCNKECKVAPKKVILNDTEEELEEEIAVINPTYNEPAISIINDILDYAICVCDDKQAHGDDRDICEICEDEEVVTQEECPEREEVLQADLPAFQKWVMKLFCCSVPD